MNRLIGIPKVAICVLAIAIGAAVVAIEAIGGGEKPGSSPGQPIAVSLIRLIASPEPYDGKFVRVFGFVRIEHEGSAIYLHREDAEQRLAKNGLWLAVSDSAPAGSREAEVKDRYALIEGRFNATKTGHRGLWSGSIEAVSRVMPWDVRKDNN